MKVFSPTAPSYNNLLTVHILWYNIVALQLFT